MANENKHFDQRGDFTGPDKGKRSFPQRPQNVPIEEDNKGKQK